MDTFISPHSLNKLNLDCLQIELEHEYIRTFNKHRLYWLSMKTLLVIILCTDWSSAFQPKPTFCNLFSLNLIKKKTWCQKWILGNIPEVLYKNIQSSIETIIAWKSEKQCTWISKRHISSNNSATIELIRSKQTMKAVWRYSLNYSQLCQSFRNQRSQRNNRCQINI